MSRDRVYLSHILESIEKIEKYARAGKDDFIRESHWHDAAIRNFEVIGEASKRLSNDFKLTRPEIPWKSIAGLRDILIHQYMGVDLQALWNVIEKDLPELKRIVMLSLESE